ncbi:MAG: DUF116 domain-containing protein [Candidatus Heimdallarchaeota archaeon]
MSTWRLLDTGHRTAAENCALDQSILKARSLNLIPNTLRILQFRPTCVLIGYHQSLSQEVRVNYCKQHGIHMNRRITGGGAIFFDETHLGWEVFADKNDPIIPIQLNRLYEKMCNCVIRGLKELGISASFRPKNDIEIDGRKISGTGGTEIGDVILFQGTLLTDLDIKSMMRALRVPIKKLSDKEILSIKDRVTSLKAQLGYLPPIQDIKDALANGFKKELGICLSKSHLSKSELKLFYKILPKFISTRWIDKFKETPDEVKHIFSLRKTPGGLIRVALSLDSRRNRIKGILITGDFFAHPSRTILDLESALKGVEAEETAITSTIMGFFNTHAPIILGTHPEDFVRTIMEAVRKNKYAHNLGLTYKELNNIFVVNTTFSKIFKSGCDTLLIPYCAKDLSCEYRQRTDCLVCGNCSVSAAYELGKRYGLYTTTIINYEHLEEVLQKLRTERSIGYIGCCCEPFFMKHFDDFERFKVPGLLIDIASESCYDLGQQDEAYQGTYENQSELRIDILAKVLSRIFSTQKTKGV